MNQDFLEGGWLNIEVDFCSRNLGHSLLEATGCLIFIALPIITLECSNQRLYIEWGVGGTIPYKV